jgi:amidase
VRAWPGGFFRLGNQGPLHYSSLADVATLIAARKLTSMDVTQQLLARVAAVDERLQSYVTVMTDHAIASAERADVEFAPAGTAGLSMACPSR